MITPGEYNATSTKISVKLKPDGLANSCNSCKLKKDTCIGKRWLVKLHWEIYQYSIFIFANNRVIHVILIYYMIHAPVLSTTIHAVYGFVVDNTNMELILVK